MATEQIAGRDCIVFVCHVATDAVRGAYERLRREAPADHDVRFLLNSDEAGASAASALADDITVVTLPELLSPGYRQKCRTENWEMAGNLDLAFLAFARRHPGYDRIWFVEYDVHWEGRWSVLFERFRASPADVLATTVLPIARVPHKLALLTYPALIMPPDVSWGVQEALKAFLPICRLSRAALEALDNAYRNGLGGHYEITVPSVAASAGLLVEDIGGDGPFVAPDNRNRFYFARGSTTSHSPGSFVFRPSPRVLKRRNTLWHPVKPGEVPLWHPMRARGRLLKNAVEMAKPLAWRLAVRLWFATRWRPYDA